MGPPILPPVVETEPRDYSSNCILFWNNVGLELHRLTHSIAGPQNGPPVSARTLGLLHLAIHDAYFNIFPASTKVGSVTIEPYLVPRPRSGPLLMLSGQAEMAKEAKDAVAGAATTVLNKLYTNPANREASVSRVAINALRSLLTRSLSEYRIRHGRPNPNSDGYRYGVYVGNKVLHALEIKANQPGASAGTYMPNSGVDYVFDDDPLHPIRPAFIDPDDPEDGTQPTRPYHGPRYGFETVVVATRGNYKIADPPINPQKPAPALNPPGPGVVAYREAIEDVHRMGGAEDLASTKRQPKQTVAGLFWAYDGANLIGTPIRLYNQILRQVAYDKAFKGPAGKLAADMTPDESDQTDAAFCRLFALANAAMTDAGIYCWREKYKYELWRPLSAVRADPSGPVPDGYARPTWRVLGAPATNSNEGGFKPPFPTYPSGHATFGAACFQIMRRFYLDKDGPAKFFPDGVKIPDKVDLKCQCKNRREKSEAVKEKEAGGAEQADIKPGPEPESETICWIHKNDGIELDFISDELNGINRELYQKYDPNSPITDQAGNVRTRIKHHLPSLWYAIFENAISRIWLGVHFHFDAFAGDDVHMKTMRLGPAGRDPNATDPNTEGADHNLPQPDGFPATQRYQVNADGTTKYKNIDDMNFFGTPGEGGRFYGAVPLGICIGDDVFDGGMKCQGDITLGMRDLQEQT